MRKKIALSVSTLVAVLAIGGGATYALLTSNTATISSAEIDTGNASIALCIPNNTWTGDVTTQFKLTGMVPGDTAKDLLNGVSIFAGNDNGNLNTLDSCTSAGNNAPSTVNLKLIPKVSNIGGTCTSDAQNDIQLDFKIGSTESGYGSLNFWTTNATQYGDVIAPGSTAQVQVLAAMSSGSTQANQACTFSITFTGVQQP